MTNNQRDSLVRPRFEPDLYKLTPSGIEEKAQVTQAFLKRKLAEYEIIQQEIAELQADVAAKEVTREVE